MKNSFEMSENKRATRHSLPMLQHFFAVTKAINFYEGFEALNEISTNLLIASSEN